MAFVPKYILRFNDTAGKDIKIEIQEDDFVFGGTAINVTCTDANLEWEQFDGIKDFGIKQSRLRFKILCTDSLPPENFIADNAIQYRVVLYCNGVANWYGFLDSTDVQFPFLDGNIEIELFARDGLHLLNSSKLEISGSEPFLFYRGTELIYRWLQLTNLSLNFWTWINIYPDGTTARTIGNPERDPFYYSFISYKTFSQDDPFTALNKLITSFGCQMFQARGKWHIVYVEDWIRDIGLSGTEWNSSGVAQGIATAQRFNFTIGLYDNWKFINEDTICSYQAASKGVRLNYNFEVPKLLRNQDLNEGDFSAFITPSAQVLYNLDHWTKTGSANLDAKILTQLDITDDSNSEVSRRITFRTVASTAFNQQCIITSSAITCNEGDYFTFKFNHGAETTLYSRVLFCQIKLYRASPLADMYLKADGKWTTTVTFLNVQGASGSIGTPSNPLSETFGNVDPIPDDATGLEIIFTLQNQGNPTPSGTYLYFVSDLDFQYDGYVATNITYKAQYNKIENTNTLKNYIEEQIFISDSQNIVFKGAIIDSTSNKLKYWYHNGITEKVRFSEIITRAIYRLYSRNFLKLEGSFQNSISNTANYLLSPLDTAFITPLPDKEFLICTLTINLQRNQCGFTFNELHDGSGNDFAATGNHQYGLVDRTERRIIEPEVEEKKKPLNYRFGLLGVLVQLAFRKKKR